jgi:predicted kinase
MDEVHKMSDDLFTDEAVRAFDEAWPGWDDCISEGRKRLILAAVARAIAARTLRNYADDLETDAFDEDGPFVRVVGADRLRARADALEADHE